MSPSEVDAPDSPTSGGGSPAGVGSPESSEAGSDDGEDSEDDEEDDKSGQSGFADGRIPCRTLVALVAGVAAAGLFV